MTLDKKKMCLFKSFLIMAAKCGREWERKKSQTKGRTEREDAKEMTLMK